MMVELPLVLAKCSGHVKLDKPRKTPAAARPHPKADRQHATQAAAARDPSPWIDLGPKLYARPPDLPLFDLVMCVQLWP
jgi:hypothetical protein